jgi:hypothetical protein
MARFENHSFRKNSTLLRKPCQFFIGKRKEGREDEKEYWIEDSREERTRGTGVGGPRILEPKTSKH